MNIDDQVVHQILVEDQSYEEVAALHERSRGWVYGILKRRECRKNEARIQARKRDRERQRQEFLQEVIDATSTMDVLDYLAKLPDESVDLHITSIPYNVGKTYGDSPSIDRMRYKAFKGWCMMVLSDMVRTLKQGHVIALQVGKTRRDDGQLEPIAFMLHDELVGMGLTFQNHVTWRIPHGLTPKTRLSDRHEELVIYCKGDKPVVFNPDSARTPQVDPGKKAYKGPNKGKLSGSPLGAWPSDVWDIPNVGHNHPEACDHPAQFPMELPRRAIQPYTLPGDLVCDVFMGSGTTAMAAVETGRAFTGCDLFYEDLRAKRLADVKEANACTLPGVTDKSGAVWSAHVQRVDLTPRLDTFSGRPAPDDEGGSSPPPST